MWNTKSTASASVRCRSIVCWWWRCSVSLTSEPVYRSGRYSRGPAESSAVWCRRFDTHISICSNTHAGLLAHSQACGRVLFQVCKCLRDGVIRWIGYRETFPGTSTRRALGACIIWGCDIKDVVSDIELEGGSWVDRLFTVNAVCITGIRAVEEILPLPRLGWTNRT